MIQQSPDELLALLKENSPDPRMPFSMVRQNFSAFYRDMQQETIETGGHQTERVPLPDGVNGYWITLPESIADRVILFFHGGGFTLGSTDDHLGMCIRLARTSQANVFSVDYRLAPEHTFPAPVEDAVLAYRYLISRGYLPHRILPAGISAGGNIVIALLLSIRDRGLPLPRAAVCMSPATDLLFPGESVQKNKERDWITPARLQAIRTVYLGSHDPADPRASPVHARMAGLPRLYVQVGTHELLLSDVGKFVDKARWSGVPVQAEIWEGMFHCWQVFADDLPEGREALEHAGAFAQDMLSR